MPVLRLIPVYKDYIWGGQRLVREYHKQYDGVRLAESWELSCRPDGKSVIAEGDGAEVLERILYSILWCWRGRVR